MGDVAADLLLQVLATLLLKPVADLLGLPAAICLALGYVGVITFFHVNVTPYFSKSRPADTRLEMQTSMKSPSWRAVTLTMTMVAIAQSLRCAMLGFYFYDYVDSQSLVAWLWFIPVARKDAFFVGLFLFILVGALSQLIGTWLFLRYFRLFGKKEILIICLMLTALFSFLFYIPQPDDISMIFLLCVLKSLAFAPMIPILWAMTGDVADYVEHQHFRRATGSCYSGVMFSLKTGLGLGIFLAGALLLFYGYTPDAPDLHSWNTLQGIRFTGSIVPGLLFAVGIATLWSYPITKTFGEQIRTELSDRRKRRNLQPTAQQRPA